jgi:hypothetical protein
MVCPIVYWIYIQFTHLFVGGQRFNSAGILVVENDIQCGSRHRRVRPALSVYYGQGREQDQPQKPRHRYFSGFGAVMSSQSIRLFCDEAGSCTISEKQPPAPAHHPRPSPREGNRPGFSRAVHAGGGLQPPRSANPTPRKNVLDQTKYGS